MSDTCNAPKVLVQAKTMLSTGTVTRCLEDVLGPDLSLRPDGCLHRKQEIGFTRFALLSKGISAKGHAKDQEAFLHEAKIKNHAQGVVKTF